MYLKETHLLNMENHIHQVCLYLVFHNRIQKSLDHTCNAWNHHKLQTEQNKTPIAIFEFSGEVTITCGYWTGDPGDNLETVFDPLYGFDGQAPMPPVAEMQDDPEVAGEKPLGLKEERAAGTSVNGDDELTNAQDMLDEC
jgi:hypothetical protein